MTPLEALQKALEALNEIDRVIESGGDPADLLDDVANIVANIIGELARGGYER
jgi:hypothetical protein